MLADASAATTGTAGRGRRILRAHTNTTRPEMTNASRTGCPKNPAMQAMHSAVVSARWATVDDRWTSHPSTKKNATPWVRNRRLKGSSMPHHVTWRSAMAPPSSTTTNR